MFQDYEYYGERFQELSFSQKELTGVRFYDCTFSKCDFSDTVFEDCTFSDCAFEACDMNLMKVLDCTFSQAAFTHSKLVGIDWTEASWPRVIGPGTLRFNECVISHSTFIGLTLPKCQFIKCIAKNVDFREAVLPEADMKHTEFAESLFGGTNLTGADLSHAINYSIDPSQNIIKKAKFMLPDAISLLYCMDIQLIDE